MAERPDPLANPRADRVRKVAALAGRSARSRYGQFPVEGPQAVRELIRHRPDLVRDVYATAAQADLADEARGAGLYVHGATDDVVRAMSPDAQGILAVARMLPPASLEALEGARLAVVLPAVADPGNAGTLIRIADARARRGLV